MELTLTSFALVCGVLASVTAALDTQPSWVTTSTLNISVYSWTVLPLPATPESAEFEKPWQCSTESVLNHLLEQGVAVSSLCPADKRVGHWTENLTWAYTGNINILTPTYPFGIQEHGGYMDITDPFWSEWFKCSTIPRRKMLFLGDSKMYYYRGYVETFLWSQGKVMIETTNASVPRNCGLLTDYYGFQRAEDWIQPNRTRLEGPKGYGLKTEHWCTDCGRCKAAKRLFRQPFHGNEIEVEFVPLEFSRDREQQSTLARTSQENLGLYLAKDGNYSDALVVFNTGIHEAGLLTQLYGNLVPTLTPTQADNLIHSMATYYEANLMWYANILIRSIKPVNRNNFLFLATSFKLQQNAKSLAENKLVVEFNKRARRVCRLLGFDFLDVTPILYGAPNTMYRDGVHAMQMYYDLVAEMILNWAGILPQSLGQCAAA